MPFQNTKSCPQHEEKKREKALIGIFISLSFSFHLATICRNYNDFFFCKKKITFR